jgi:cysteinyl-tRNA synthetase
MVAFVSRLADYARARRPGFLVVPQNGEELLQYPDYLAAIDAVGKEDLLFGLRGNERANSWSEVESSVSYLKAAQASRRPVLVVEYLRDIAKREAAQHRLRELGFVASFSARPPYRWLEVSDRAGWRLIRPLVPAVQTTARP